MNTHTNQPESMLQYSESVCGVVGRVPDEDYTIPSNLLLQNEAEALRDELEIERQRRAKAELELSRLKFQEANSSTFLGFPIRHYDCSDDDRRRTSWEAKIDGTWHEIITSGLRFDKMEALESICFILRSKV